MSEVHQIVCDNCDTTRSLNCPTLNPRAPRGWTSEGPSDYCKECSEDMAAATGPAGGGDGSDG